MTSPMAALVRASDLPGTIWHLLRFVGLGLALYSLRTPPGRLFVGSTLLAMSPIALIVGLVSLGEDPAPWLIGGALVGAAAGLALVLWGRRASAEGS